MPVGPVAQRFGVDPAILKCIMGPVGSAKTTECIATGIRVGGMQEPVWNDRRRCWVKTCRGAVVRDTYPNLDRTVIKSWHRWFPKTLGRWSGEAPRTHSFTLSMGKGTPDHYELDIEVIFVAIGDNAIEDVLRGLELTWLWLNEMDLLPRAIIEFGIGRVGRFPSGDLGRCRFPQIFGDMNAPEEDNWTVATFIDKKLDPEAVKAFEKRFANDNGEVSRPLISFYRQPGGMDDGAENLHNLEGGRSYYEMQVALLPADKARRMVHNRIGPVRAGTPVFPEFQDDHLYDSVSVVTGNVRAFDPIPGLPVLIGADQGLLGAAILAQLDPRTDQLFVLDELARIFETGDGHIEVSQIGAEAFGAEVRQRLVTRFPGLIASGAWCDPAGLAGENAINSTSWRKDFQKGLGITVRRSPVPGNAIAPRLKAVRERIAARIAGKPRLVVHPRCTILRKAFNSKYVLQRVAVGSTLDGGRFADKPLKVQGYADVMDALQYLAVAVEKGALWGEAEERDAPRTGKRRRARVDHGGGYFQGEEAA